jgi:ABC-type sugar transport system ATPase subunit
MSEDGATTEREARIEVRQLDMAYGARIIQRDLTFTVQRGDIFVIMGGSGSGKSTLLRHMIGLLEPARGQVLYDGRSFWGAEAAERERMTRRFGVLYQSGALWSSMTLAENVSLPLEQYTDLSSDEIRDLVTLKLALVGLAGFEEFYPAEIRTALASVNSALEGAKRLMATGKTSISRLETAFEGTAAKATDTLQDVQALVRRVDRQTVPAVNETLQDTQQLVRRVHTETLPAANQVLTDLRPLVADVRQAVGRARVALEQAETTLVSVDGALEENSPLGYQIKTTLADVSAAARAFRSLSSYLERYPDAVIFGKNGKGK